VTLKVSSATIVEDLVRIEWVMLCTAFEDGPDGITIHGIGSETRLLPDGVPAELGVRIALCLVARYDELGGGSPHLLTCRVMAPDLSVVHSGRQPPFLMGPPGPLHYEGSEGRQIYSFEIRFPAETEGPYTVGVALDDDAPLTVPVFVHALAS
jgi:hypothetical protein